MTVAIDTRSPNNWWLLLLQGIALLLLGILLLLRRAVWHNRWFPRFLDIDKLLSEAT